ncbi:GlxA family transcriptional regulator [Chitinophaga vietnamensis]|uniref:GlxA family transcriptional regulator n=1 Tax=Chitinophaga vietnamensis TaxID=2593957 RepID=UPI0011774A42|nr:helix-turn-helix domain-containing protein [Chitinophaga vietnamensis]
MRIGILNYENAVPTSVSGPADILSAMSRSYPRFTGNALPVDFEIDIVSEEEGQLFRQPFGSHTRKKLSPQYRYDLVIIPAMQSDKIMPVLRKEQHLIRWLQQQYRQHAELASICVGAFLLGATSLLNGKTATTHWMFADLFRKMYPEVTLQDDKIIIDQGRIYTCGGAFSFTTFTLYLAEKFCGPEAAMVASKLLMINIHQQPQTTFSIFQLQKDHADEDIAQAQQFIEKQYHRSISVEALAAQANMSLRNFIRRFEQATSNTPLEYLQRVRMEAAKKMLENTNKGIEQIAGKCGYEDMSFFRKIFKRHVAMTPTAYREKYGKSIRQAPFLSLVNP